MTKKLYRDIFFDLDHTLWDFETNSLETLNEIFDKHALKAAGMPDANTFIEVYHRHNHRLWSDYRRGEILKEDLRINRFKLCLNEFDIHSQPLIEAIANDYVSISPTKTNLFPHTLEVLDYLGAKYRMHIITNGFEEVQFTKLRHSGLMNYFTEVITSEDAGATKPNPAIFGYALKRSGAKAETSIMIGDDEETDIKGAKQAGMDQVLFDVTDNQQGSLATYRITSLDQLTHIL
ncbi:MAG: YjjG family noncanonical pyrimidine nucleotidase [Lentimicrobium sp.]|jgi:putative hydrolase of the HAD superfamily|nr:YjjG family noncanonical pyrimidine nucleotidase [Lentimicrobium sp.]